MVHVVQVNNEPTLVHQSLHKSPFYNGHTTYGGRAASRPSNSGSPYKVCDVLSHTVCCLLVITLLCAVHNAVLIIIVNDNVYGAVIVTQSLREFTRFI